MQSSYILIVIAVHFLLLFCCLSLISQAEKEEQTMMPSSGLTSLRSGMWLLLQWLEPLSRGWRSFLFPAWCAIWIWHICRWYSDSFWIHNYRLCVLLPLYYRLNLTTIYGYLGQRYGRRSYKTGAWFFLISKIVGAAARLYLVVFILQTLVFDAWGVPFVITVVGIILAIWLYSHKSGVRTIIWTDWIQTLLFLSALVMITWQVMHRLDF